MILHRPSAAFPLRPSVAAALAAALLAAAVPSASTAPGDLDPSFGSGGKAIVDIGTSRDEGEAVVQQSDSKLVVCGRAFNGAGFDFLLLRYNADGTLDASFGAAGRVLTDFGNTDDHALALDLQSDGKIVAAGYSATAFAVARYNTDGSLDATFGTGGRVTTSFGVGTYASAYGVVVQSDGRIVAAGRMVDPAGTNGDDFALARYNADGTPDAAGFGTGGLVVTSIGGSYVNDDIYGVALQTDGMIVVAGSSGSSFAAARYTTAGVLDGGFASVGYAVTGFPSTFGDYGTCLAVQSDGMIVVAGRSYNSSTFNDDLALVRYTSGGAVDTGFGTGGTVRVDAGTAAADVARAVIVQPDTTIVVAGFSGYDFVLARFAGAGALDTAFGTSGFAIVDFGGRPDQAGGLVRQAADGFLVAAGFTGADVALARCTTGGATDAAFGSGGRVVTDVRGGSDDFAGAVRIQSDGRIVAAGRAFDGQEGHVALVRLNADGTTDSAFGVSGRVDVQASAASGDSEARALLLQPDGRIVAGGVSVGSSTGNDLTVMRLNADGTADAGFGSGGTARMDVDGFGSNDELAALALQTDGRIVAAGSAYTAPSKPSASAGGARRTVAVGFSPDFVVARFNADGTPDGAFGSGGVTAVDFAASSDVAEAVVVQPDGKIVAGGFAYTGQGPDFALARLNADGTLDAGFGTGGRVVTDFASGSQDQIKALALQTDGKIVAAGFSVGSVALARYNPDGTLDTAFGTGGLVTTPVGASATAYDVALLADGRIVVAGRSDSANFVVARYNADGGPDAGFGSGGRVVTPAGGGAAALAIQTDGNIVAAGDTMPAAGGGDFAVLRFLGGDTADLAVTMGAPAGATVGGTLTYTLVVSNAGPDPAGGVTVTDALPAGVAFVSATAGQGSVSGTSTVSASLGTILPGGTATVTIVVTAATVGTVVNSAAVSGAVYDPASGNDAAAASTVVSPLAADLALAMAATPASVSAGGAVTYTLTVINNGPDAASGVTVVDTLPPGATLLSSSASQGTLSGTSTVTASLGTLSAGGTATVILVASPAAAGFAVNAAAVSSAVGDPASSNDTASASTAATGTLLVGPGPAVPSALQALAGAPGVPVAQLALTASGGDLRLDGFLAAPSGTMNAASGIAGGALWVDANGNGVVDAADSPVDSAAFPFASGPTSVDGAGGGLGVVVPAGSTVYLLFTVDLANGVSPGETFAATASSFAVTDAATGLIVPTAFSGSGGLLTVGSPGTATSSPIVAGSSVDDYIMFAASIQAGAAGFDQIVAQFGAPGPGGTVRLFRYDPGTGFYDEFGAAEFDAKYPDMNPAFGWWFIASGAGNLQLSGTSTAVTDPSGFSIALAPGWNQVGNPYDAALPLAMVEVGGVPFDAASSALTLPSAYRFQRGSYVVETSALQPRVGYWVKNVSGSPQTLYFRRPPTALKPGAGAPRTRALRAGEESPPPPPSVAGGTGLKSGGAKGGGGVCFAGGGAVAAWPLVAAAVALAGFRRRRR